MFLGFEKSLWGIIFAQVHVERKCCPFSISNDKSLKVGSQ